MGYCRIAMHYFKLFKSFIYPTCYKEKPSHIDAIMSRDIEDADYFYKSVMPVLPPFAINWFLIVYESWILDRFELAVDFVLLHPMRSLTL
jgi:hypothetical protein